MLHGQVYSAGELPPSDSPGAFAEGVSRVHEEGRVIAVELLNDRGTVYFARIVRLDDVIRGEFHKEEVAPGRWSIDHHEVRVQEPLFTLRAPYLPDAVLRVQSRAGVFVLPVEPLLESS